MAEGYLSIDGLRIRYQQSGAGAPVLLLHGWGGQIESFHPVTQAVAVGFRATAIDFPGHGKSALPPRPWHVSDFLDVTLKIMDRLEIERASIIAHSFGGRVSIKMAARHPERVERILFTAGAGVPAPLSASRKLKRTVASVLKPVLPAGVRQKLLRFAVSSDYLNAGELRPTLSHVIAEDLTGYLKEIRTPCLLIWGDQDRETPLYCGQVMAREIQGAELVVFPGAGHFPYLDQTTKFNLLAMKFLRGEQP